MVPCWHICQPSDPRFQVLLICSIGITVCRSQCWSNVVQGPTNLYIWVPSPSNKPTDVLLAALYILPFPSIDTIISERPAHTMICYYLSKLKTLQSITYSSTHQWIDFKDVQIFPRAQNPVTNWPSIQCCNHTLFYSWVHLSTPECTRT
jgi:hypothetical protein